MNFKTFIEPKNYTIYVDLDGVLCDFKGQFIKLTNQDPQKVENESKTKFWKIVKNLGVPFWSTMPWVKGSKKMWKFLKDNFKDVQVLSALSKEKESKIGKRKWIERELKNTKYSLVYLSKNKQNYSGKNKILIDDRKDNIEQWKVAGGIGVLFKTPEQVISELRTYTK